jgi:hypothetical protein
MTDVGNVQAGAVGTAQVVARPKVQAGPLKGLPIVAAVVVFVIVPLVIAFTVARYSSSPAAHAGSLPDVSRPA